MEHLISILSLVLLGLSLWVYYEADKVRGSGSKELKEARENYERAMEFGYRIGKHAKNCAFCSLPDVGLVLKNGQAYAVCSFHSVHKS